MGERITLQEDTVDLNLGHIIYYQNNNYIHKVSNRNIHKLSNRDIHKLSNRDIL